MNKYKHSYNTIIDLSMNVTQRAIDLEQIVYGETRTGMTKILGIPFLLTPTEESDRALVERYFNKQQIPESARELLNKPEWWIDVNQKSEDMD